MKRMCVAIVAALGMLFAVQAWAQAPSDSPRPLAQRQTVKIGISSRVEVFAAMLLAKEFGEFERENLDVEFVFQRPSDGLVLLSTGRIDVLASQPSAGFFNAVAGGVDAKMVAPIGFSAPDNKQGFWVSRAWLAGRPYEPSLLKGQPIGSSVGVGTTVSYWAEVELEKAGLDVRAVTWRTMGVTDILAALENGAVNVGFLFDGIWQKADMNKVVFAFGGVPDVGGAYFYGPRLLHERRDVGEAVMRAATRTVRQYLQGKYHSDPKVSGPLAHLLGIPEEALRDSGELSFPPNMPLALRTAAVLQKTYALNPDVLTYRDPLPDEKVIDRGFVAAEGIAPPLQ